jgi:hypothetical protein
MQHTICYACTLQHKTCCLHAHRLPSFESCVASMPRQADGTSSHSMASNSTDAGGSYVQTVLAVLPPQSAPVARGVDRSQVPYKLRIP